MPVAQLTSLDYVVMAIYFAFVLGIGWALRRMMRTSTDFFLSGRSLPPWVTGLAFLSANLGAQEVIGMGASGAKYGIATSHFYWVGAIPAMVFVGIFMMPFYYGSRVRSVPEYLKLRFDDPSGGDLLLYQILETLSLGIEGKSSLWTALEAAAEDAPALRLENYDALRQRAVQQRDRVESHRITTARKTFAPSS